MCRYSAYSYIVKTYPELRLPCSDTINKRIRNLQAHSGIQFETLEYLLTWDNKLKNDCILVIDEIFI